MSEAAFLLLHLDGPMLGWGGTARDGRRPSAEVPGVSAITGLLANAVGWRYEDAERTEALKRSLRLACCRLELPGAELFDDYQTARLRITDRGWTRRGSEGRTGDNSDGTTILRKQYRANVSCRAAVGLRANAPVTVQELEDALRRPARTLFLGRRSCLPSMPILGARVSAVSAYVALRAWVADAIAIWHNDGEQGDVVETDDRDFRTDRWAAGSRAWRLVLGGGGSRE
ncbi:MAG: type I-E CRISPR-associated protein Cas5/CasD [Gemmatimonadales bacterium]|nr:type I-E CRISPR-associated protein Cas5/CasD [Gemmatimonadales bacterium]